MERLPSRRNHVVRTRRGIEKTFESEAAMRTECGQLHLLHARGVGVPAVLAHAGRTLVLSDLRAPTLYDALWMLESSCAPVDGTVPLWEALACWLLSYYDAVQHARTGQIRSDMHARNFLWNGTRIFGVDFEQTACGEREADAGALCAYLYTYDPAQTDFKRALITRCMDVLTQVLGLDVQRLKVHMQGEWEAMAQRRPGFCMPFDTW